MMTHREIADTVVIDPGIKPEDIRDCLIDNVNLAWRAGGNDGRCNIAANFVGWMLQENDRLTRELAEARAEADRLRAYHETWQRTVPSWEKENERLRDAWRVLWLVVSSNGGYTIEKSDLEGYPGGDRAIITSMIDHDGNMFIAASTRDVEQSTRPADG